MTDYPYSAPDLNSVLQTLSSLSSQNSPSQNTLGQSEVSVPAPQQPPEARVPARPQSGPSKASGTPTTDPTTITTWPAALRYVMRATGQDEETQLRVRGLIRSQHSHERQWWKGREALVQRQQARGEKKKELDAVLRSVGAPVDSKEISTTNEDQAELAKYDAKVYRASAQMAEALTAELRGLNIPFFVLRKSLIHESSAPGSGEPSSKHDEIVALEDGSSKVTKSELAALQRRMLELLQDLCKE